MPAFVRASLPGLFVLALVYPLPLLFADNGGVVAGFITLDKGRPPTPKLGHGFVPRAKNALVQPRGHDPRNEIVVVLSGGPIDEADKKPRDWIYEIVGENFATDIKPVVIGSKGRIRNRGRAVRHLLSLSEPDFVEGDPINPSGERPTKPVSKLHTPIDVRDEGTTHFVGHVVAFSHSYFAVPTFDGSFEVTGVPAGTWNVRIWYRDGWVTNLSEPSVTVVAGRTTKPVRVSLPAKLLTKASAQ